MMNTKEKIQRLLQSSNHQDHATAEFQKIGYQLVQEAIKTELTLSASPHLYEILERLFSHNIIQHQNIALAASHQVKFKYNISHNSCIDHNLTVLLTQDILFLALLKKTINVDREFELFLIDLREYLLLRYQQKKLTSSSLALLSAMAEQCFNNEHIFKQKQNKNEQQAINAINQLFIKQLSQHNSGPINEIELLLLSLYLPLTQNPAYDNLADYPISHFTYSIQATIQRLVFNYFDEKKIKKQIQTFSPIVCATSAEVQRQYEEHPYPRWIKLDLNEHTVEQDIQAINSTWKSPFLNNKSAQILVPGCGTGQQPLKLAANNPEAEIIAIDLSKSSLAYAQRMAKQYKLSNIQFLQGDLQDISRLNKKFHHIDCVGVLHHMQNPSIGLKALEEVLLPGGTMFLGLYSKVARFPIQIARQKIKSLNLKATPSEMNFFRQQLLNLPEYQTLYKALISYDFYTLSCFRDLIFHSCEHTYTLSEINSLIKQCKLQFLGFDPGPLREKLDPNPLAPLETNSYEHWTKLESSYTGTKLLFKFWLHKSTI